MSLVRPANGPFVGFAGFPEWTREIQITFGDVSPNCAYPSFMQLGSARGLETEGYDGCCVAIGGHEELYSQPAGPGFIITQTAGPDVFSGILTLVKSIEHSWILSGSMQSGSYVLISAGRKALAGPLTELRIMCSARGCFNGGDISLLCIG